MNMPPPASDGPRTSSEGHAHRAGEGVCGRHAADEHTRCRHSLSRRTGQHNPCPRHHLSGALLSLDGRAGDINMRQKGLAFREHRGPKRRSVPDPPRRASLTMVAATEASLLDLIRPTAKRGRRVRSSEPWPVRSRPRPFARSSPPTHDQGPRGSRRMSPSRKKRVRSGTS
jgi:hypothetical protein